MVNILFFMIFFNSHFGYFFMLLDPFVSHAITIDTSGRHCFILQDDTVHSSDIIIDIQSAVENVEIIVQVRANIHSGSQKKWKINVSLQGNNQSAFLDIRAVVDEGSFFVLDGGVEITKTSTAASAELKEKIVLFEKTARARVTPRLTVSTDTVKKASHSASIAPFSDDVFFFLESRGISRTHAKHMLAMGVLK